VRSGALLLACLLAAGCGDAEGESRGLEVLPDMYHSPAPRTQSALAPGDGTVHRPAAQEQPEGAVPRRGAGYRLAPGDLAAARRLLNPLLPEAAVLARGERAYLVHCSACHGRDGDAGRAAMAPYLGGIPSLRGPGALHLCDGEIFHFISAGKGRMPDLRAQLAPDERWAVVHFLRVQAAAAAGSATAGGPR
jgi:mono/diheme cytochrome c family protein